MFTDRRNCYYQNYPYLSSYNHAQIEQYRENVLATRAKLQAYKEAIIEAELKSRANDGVTFVGGTMIDPSGGTPPTGQDFTPYGHVSRAGSTPQSYSLWGSSGESNADSITSHRRRFGKNLCRVVTGCAVVLVLLAVSGIVGIAVYLGYASSEDEGPTYADQYVGNLRVLQGDSWVQDLTYPSSPAFRAKATKYKNMLRSVFENSVLGPAFDNAEVNQFAVLNPRKTGFEMTFQLNLDRRKIPFWYMKDTDVVIQKILEQELQSPSPVAFQNLKVDIESFDVKKLKIASEVFEYKSPSPKESRKEEFEVVPLKGIGGILKVKSSEVSQFNGKEIERIISEQRERTTQSPTSTIRHLVYELGPWKPIDPNYMYDSSSESQRFESREETDRIEVVKEDYSSHSSNNRKNFRKQTARVDLDLTKSTTVFRTTSSPSSTIVFRTTSSPSLSTVFRTTGSPSSTTVIETTNPPSSSTTEFKTTPKSHYSTDASPFEKEIKEVLPATEITKNQLYNRVGLPSASPSSSLHGKNKVEKEISPSMKDIQSILENLLFLATIKPSGLLNNTFETQSGLNMNSEVKTDLNSETVHVTEDQLKGIKSTTSSYHLKTNYESSPVSPVTSYSGVRDFERPYLISNGAFPLDRFRYQTQLNTKRVPTTTEKTNFSSSKEPRPLDIWDMLTTKKPLILDTEIVTSTSFDVKYGSSTEGLMPVYVHSSTIRNILESAMAKNHSLPEVVIPVISGKEVKYIKVNRTKSNYPNVVIVNLADSEDTGKIFESTSINNKAREIEFNAKFLKNISNILTLIKQQKIDQTVPTNINEEFYKRYGKPVTMETKIPLVERPETTTPSTSFWNVLTRLSKFYPAEQNIKNEQNGNLRPIPIISEVASSSLGEPPLFKELKDHPHFPLAQESILHSLSSFPNRKSNRKSGKSLKFSQTLTLFVVKREDGRGAKVISVAGRSPSITSSSQRTNSPIHIFTFKEGQSLEELLAEIVDAISKDEENPHQSDQNENERHGYSNLNSGEGNSDQNDVKFSSLPAGEDSLKIIEALSKLLTDHYDNYNIVFGGGNHEEITTANPSLTTTQVKLDSSPFKSSSIIDSLNEISPTTENYGSTLTSKYPKKDRNYTYHRYQHELFPVMTRPMNPIKTTTPKTVTTIMDSSENDETATASSKPAEVVTSFDVSYSMLAGNKNISFPVRIDSNSTGCHENEFRCSTGKCIPKLARCNMVRDCSDNSDEKNCNCSDILTSQHYVRKICDGIIDCWDKSDETYCDWCSPGHFICTGYRKCVKPEMVCDGFPDCPNGDDERDCVTIAPNVVQANSIEYFEEGYLMVRRKGIWGKLCVENFEDAVSKADVSWSVTDLGEAVCKTLTFDSSSEVEKAYDSSPPISRSASAPYYEINITFESPDKSRPRSLKVEDSHFNLKRSLSGILSEDLVSQHLVPTLKGSFSFISKAFKDEVLHQRSMSHVQKRDASDFELTLQFQETKCIKKDVVKVKCEDLQCGVRPRATTQQARIVGGSSSSPGAWPWHAALYKEGEYQCGATLISAQWLISAGHCFYSARDAYWVARMGALRRGTKFPSPFEQLRALSHIFIHPEYVNHGYINDISLLRLKESIKLNDYVRPACLPPPGVEVNDGQRCTLVGWGQLFEVKKIFPDTLQEVEVPLISTTECRKRTVFFPLYRITEDMFCAGYDRGGRDACLGDSGGPLMCQKSDGRWEVLGVTSNGYGCARPQRPGVYTKVVNYLYWIDQVLELGNDDRVISVEAECDGHRCPLGQCISISRICNGKVECSDGSDERDCS